MSDLDDSNVLPFNPVVPRDLSVTLRDWFAAMAPAEEIDPHLGSYRDHTALLERIAKARYRWADAMLAERSRK